MSALLPVSLVGSYPQPDWLIDRAELQAHGVPRVRATALWRIPEPLLEEAQRDATLVAIRSQEEAGLDIITDGEIRRESYFNRFATALDGIDNDHPGTALSRGGRPTAVPRVTGPIRRRRPVEVEDMIFLRAHTRRLAKITVPGPFTMTQLAQNEHYPDEESLAMAYADAVNEEIRDLFDAGADFVQIDEPYMQAQPEKARRYADQGDKPRARRHHRHDHRAHVLRLCRDGEDRTSRIATPSSTSCATARASRSRWRPRSRAWIARRSPRSTTRRSFSGVIDLSDMQVESPQTVAARIRQALPYVKAANIIVAPDCGMKYLPREVAFGKMQAMVEGAKIVRAETARCSRNAATF